MKVLMAIFLVVLSYSLQARQQIEEKEFAGTLKDFEIGLGFAIQFLMLKVGDRMEYFSFPTTPCRQIGQTLRIGSELHVRVKVDKASGCLKTPESAMFRFLRLPIAEVTINGNLQNWNTCHLSGSQVPGIISG